MAAKPYVIALEEHYLDPEIKQATGRTDAIGPRQLIERLDDLGELRLREMDDAGIDFQVLSHSIPGLQGVDAATGVPLAQRANNRLAEAVRAHPDRFAGFAALPTADPRAAADELERTVTKLGFNGAMINGLTGGVFHDDERFWPIYERAAALDVPIYIHPALLCCMMEMGIDRILFSVDYPFMENAPGAEWIKTLPLSAEDQQKLLNGNARRLLKL